MPSLSQTDQGLETKTVLPQKLVISEITKICLLIHKAIIVKDTALYFLPKDNSFELAKEGTSQGIEFLNPAEVLEWGSKLTPMLGDDWETHNYAQQRLERIAKRFIESQNS
jgi:hypothetical protein